MKRLLLYVGLFVFALAVPSRASACEKCTLARVCDGGGADGCYMTEVCMSPQFGGISWANCVFDVNEDYCHADGEICRWA